MADEHPTPEDDSSPEISATPARPKGAGWEDDDLQRRDHGPRPEVPNHGARPFLIGIPILLITIAAIAAIVIAGGGDDGKSGSMTTGSGASGSTESTTAKVVAGIKASAAGLAGRADPTLLADVTCEPTDGATENDFRCAFGADGDPDGGTLRARLQADGTVTKILGTDPPTPGQPRSDDVATWLVQDDEVTGASKVSYGCATSTRLNPGGGASGGDGQGQRCVLIEAVVEGEDKLLGQRYVQFAPDGTVERDFLLPPE